MFSPAFVLVLLAELNSIHIKTFPPALVPVGRSKMSKPPSYTFNELLKKKKNTVVIFQQHGSLLMTIMASLTEHFDSRIGIK